MAKRPKSQGPREGGNLYKRYNLSGVYVYEHRLIVERVLGRPLPKGAEVHHVNGDHKDNRPENLVVCPSRQYHSLLHQRQRALEATGNPNLRLCRICKKYDYPENLYIHNTNAHHVSCHTKHQYEKRRARK